MERMKKPKFIKEIEKFEGKERAECGRWYIRVYGELDHKPMVELESLEMVVKELHKLEEENKKLKEKNEKLEEDNINLISFNEHYSPDVIVKYEDRYETAYNEECIENAKLCDKMRRLEEENKKLKSDLDKYKKYYDRDKEELMESCYSLAKENDKLKSDLEECECSFGFESDEVGFWKREYKRLKKWIKDHCKGYGNLFPEDEMKRQWKKADKKRK